MSFEVEQSFRNIVRFYNRELVMISEGYKASNCFSNPQRRKLIKIGVLERVYQQGGCRLKLTEKALGILNSIDPSFRTLR